MVQARDTSCHGCAGGHGRRHAQRPDAEKNEPTPLAGTSSLERGSSFHPATVMYRSLDTAVQVVSFSEARESFKAVLDRVEADADVTLITRRHAKGAVVMSLDTYNSLMETVHLLRSPANAAHLQRSLEQADRGELISNGLIDPDLGDAGD